MNACHSVGRPMNLFISNFSNFVRISTFKAAVAPLKSSPDWGPELMFPDEVLGVEGIGEFIWRDLRVESMRTTRDFTRDFNRDFRLRQQLHVRWICLHFHRLRAPKSCYREFS